MKRFIGMLIFVLPLLMLSAAPSILAVKKSAKFKHTDRNKDGHLSAKERAMERKWENKHKAKVNTPKEARMDIDSGVTTIHPKRSKVNTALEAQYDDNDDGYLTADEVDDYLEARRTLIKSNGKAKVDSALEEEYDFNNDGIIDEAEAELMVQSIEE